MAVILEIALPFFAVIALGYLSLRQQVLGEAALAGLNAFVFRIALPPLIFLKVATADVGAIFDWRLVAAYYGPTLALFATVLLVSIVIRGTLASAGLRALAASYANSGYMGIPLLLAAFDEQAALVAVMAVLLDNIVAVPIVVALCEGQRGRGAGAGLRLVLGNLARNPLMIAILLGLLVALARIPLPGFVLGLLNFVAPAASPCALFALGGALHGVPFRIARVEVSLVTLAKIVLHPLAVFLVGSQLVGLPEALLAPAVIVAALPTAASVFVLARRYEVFVLRSSTIILLTHLASVVTLSILLVIFAS